MAGPLTKLAITREVPPHHGRAILSRVHECKQSLHK